jgi:hypothetical protein
MVGEGIDEVLQLEEGTRKVRHDPKGADVGGTGELTEGERNCGAVVWRWRGGGGGDPVGRARTQGWGERGRRVIGCLSVLMREDERGKKGGTVAMGWPL